jgi:hypothetical protein
MLDSTVPIDVHLSRLRGRTGGHSLWVEVRQPSLLPGIQAEKEIDALLICRRRAHRSFFSHSPRPDRLGRWGEIKTAPSGKPEKPGTIRELRVGYRAAE